jgi:zinc transport system substrate-binding protein
LAGDIGDSAVGSIDIAHQVEELVQTQSSLTMLTLLIVSFVSGCSRSSDVPAEVSAEPRSGIVTVYTVNYPLKYFAERIGGEQVRVVFPGPADEDPALWKPDAETIAAYQRAELILLNGASYAKWTSTVSLPETRIVDTSASVVDQYIKVEDAVTHSHGPGGEHAHASTAFTIWLDTRIALAQGAAIQQALRRLRPQHEAGFQQNVAALQSDLNELDRELSAAVKRQADRPVIFSHPVYQYLQRRYSLNARSVHWEPAEVPPQKMWDELAKMLKQHPAKWMVWEATPADETVKRLNDLGVQSTVFDPCGNQPEEGDFLDVMRRNVENLRLVFAD